MMEFNKSPSFLGRSFPNFKRFLFHHFHFCPFFLSTTLFAKFLYLSLKVTHSSLLIDSSTFSILLFLWKDRPKTEHRARENRQVLHVSYLQACCVEFELHMSVFLTLLIASGLQVSADFFFSKRKEN